MTEQLHDKPYLSFKRQLKHLEQKYGLVVDYSKDISRIKSFSYYDLINGTKEVFMEDEKYIDGTSLQDLALFTIFDKDFQNILLKYSLYAETKYKNILSNLVADKFGCHQNNYLNIDKYEQHKKKSIIKTFAEINYVLESENLMMPTKHYVKNKNHVPPWILFKNVSFSTLIDFVYFLPHEEKVLLSKGMLQQLSNDDSRINTLVNCLTIIRLFRNTIAHNYKFITFSSRSFKIPKVTLNITLTNTLVTYNEVRNKDNWNDSYSMLLSLVLINDQAISLLMVREILELIGRYSVADVDIEVMTKYFSFLDYPDDFAKRLEIFLLGA